MLDFLWSNATRSAFVGRIEAAEARLIDYAKTFGNFPGVELEFTTQDTRIPFEALPLKDWYSEKKRKEGYDLHLHSVRVDVKKRGSEERQQSPPLVILVSEVLRARCSML